MVCVTYLYPFTKITHKIECVWVYNLIINNTSMHKRNIIYVVGTEKKRASTCLLAFKYVQHCTYLLPKAVNDIDYILVLCTCVVVSIGSSTVEVCDLWCEIYINIFFYHNDDDDDDTFHSILALCHGRVVRYMKMKSFIYHTLVYWHIFICFTGENLTRIKFIDSWLCLFLHL